MSNYGYGQNRYDDRAGGQPYGGGGYGNPQPYGNQQPYDSRPMYDETPPNGRQPQYNMPSNGRDEYEESVELKPLVQNGQQYGQSNGNAVLDECRSIQQAVKEITQSSLPQIQGLQRAVINDPDTSPNSKNARDLQAYSDEIMATYSDLTTRVRVLKSNPQANTPKNRTQVTNTATALKTAINQFQQIDTQHSKQLKTQMARQYRIVRPEASEAEVRDAVEDPNGQQVFSQALMQGNRRGEATSILNAVQNRHQEIQKIESQMIQLAQLFSDMEVLVMQQEAAVVNIEQKGEEVVENMDKGTEQIGVAIQSAKNTRKWKWWCLWICVAIVIVIVIIVLLYIFVFGPNAKSNRDATQSKPAKRWVLPSVDMLGLPAGKPCSKSNVKVPTLVSEGFELVRRARRFQA